MGSAGSIVKKGQAKVSHTPVVPVRVAPAPTAHADEGFEIDDEALVTYNSWEDEDPPIPGTPMPTCRIDHRNAVRNTNRFLRNVLKDPAKFVARFPGQEEDCQQDIRSEEVEVEVLRF